MEMYRIKEISIDLGITPQAIYNQKAELIKKGYMMKNSSNDWEITNDGYEYLKERKKKRIKQKQTSLIQDEQLQLKMIIKIYEERIEELKQNLIGQKELTEYFKELYEEEKMKRKK